MKPEIPITLGVLFDVVDALEALGVRYHLGGSFASAIHGVPRQTMDADLVVDLEQGTTGLLVERLAAAFYVDLDVAKGAVTRHGSFNVIHLETGFKIDFFVKGDTEYDEVELERSELQLILTDPPRSAYVKSAEDTVLRKLQWFKDGGEVSERQWRDVLGVLLAGEERMDLAYMEVWAKKLGLVELLRKALKESEE